MKAPRRGLSVLAVLVLLAASAWAETTVDFGGSLSNTTGLEAKEATGLVQRDSLSLWFQAQGLKLGFLARAGYTFSLQGGQITHIPNVEELSLTAATNVEDGALARLGFSFGRFRFVDFTGLIVNQALDGLTLDMVYPFATVKVQLGTSILPNKKAAPVVLSVSDALDLSNGADDQSDGAVYMGSPRVVGLLRIVFPSVLRQRITVSLGMQEDLRQLVTGGGMAGLFPDRAGVVPEGTATVSPSAGGLVDTQYAGLGVRGNIAGGLFYRVFGVVGTGRTLSYYDPLGGSSPAYWYTPVLAGLASASLNFYAEQFLGSSAGIRFLFSSGDSWGERTSYLEGSVSGQPSLFLPVTAQPLSLVFGPGLGNVMTLDASYSLLPLAWSGVAALESLRTALKAVVFLRPEAGPVSVAVPSSASTSLYLGTELDLSVGFRPFSDLAAELNAGIFLPNGGPGGPFEVAGAPSGAQWRVDLGLTFSF